MILEQIIREKREEILRASEWETAEELVKKACEQRPPSFADALQSPGINVISEIKYRSPSRGLFSCCLSPVEIASSYVRNGAAALSVLTDHPFFGGSLEYLRSVAGAMRDSRLREGREDEAVGGGFVGQIPLLRKDFILERLQVAEALEAGAAAFLLIVACLERGRLKELVEYGGELSLDALVEVHDAYELESAVFSGAQIIGVNNRNLMTFEVDIRTSFEIARRMEGEEGYLLVAESGISQPSQIRELRDAGFNAFLIGSAFMDTTDPGGALDDLLSRV